jgi:hypothetical protein
MSNRCEVLLEIAIASGVPCPTLALVVMLCSSSTAASSAKRSAKEVVAVSSSLADDEEERAPQTTQRAETPPQSDPALAPLSAAAMSAASAMTGPSSLSSSTIAKGSKRNIGSLRNEAANVIRRAWYRHKLNSTLRRIFAHAAATKFQALYRAHCNRREYQQLVHEKRNEWVIARYAYHRTVDLKKVPNRHVVFLAARKIQLGWRRRRSHILVARQRRLRAAVRLQRFYRRTLFVRFMGTATERRVLHDRRTLAAIKIQSLCRGVLTRRLCKSGAWQQWSAEAGARLAPQQRRARQEIVTAVEAEVRRQAAKDHATKTQRELLERILKVKEPNRDIVMWSAESAIAEPLEMPSAVSAKGRPLTMVPISSGAAGFVSQAQPLRPSATSVYLEQRAVAQEVNRVRSAKRQAASVAAAAIQKRIAILGEHPDESATTRFVLEACEGVVK